MKKKAVTSPTKPTSGEHSLLPYIFIPSRGFKEKCFFSLGSVDELATLDDMEESTGAWQDELGDRMMQITERKKTSFASREEAFSAYIRILCAKYAKEEIYLKKKDLIDSMLRSVKNGRTEKESLLASKGLCCVLLLRE